MTYKEAYMECETLDELSKMVANDIFVARTINPDRISVIERAANEVAIKKFG